MLIQGVKVCLFTVSENLLPRWVAVPSTYLSCISKNIRNNLLNLLRVCIELKRRKYSGWWKHLDTIQPDMPGGPFPQMTFPLSVFSLPWWVMSQLWCTVCHHPMVSHNPISFPSLVTYLSDSALMTSRSSGEAGPGTNSTSLWWARERTDTQSLVFLHQS